jgi:hypothetical protein
MPKTKAKTKAGKQRKVAAVMREAKAGKLHSGSAKGPVVKNRKQAIAIALSEAKLSKPPSKRKRKPKRAKRRG